MKKLIQIISLLFISASCFSQQLSTTELIKAIMNVDAVFKYRNFKTDYQNMIKELTKDEKLKSNPELYYKLQKSYTDTKKEFDGFLVVIKSDISDYNSVIDMVNNPEKYAVKYLNAYNNAATFYEGNFIPVYTEVINSQPASRSLLTPQLLKLTIDGFSILVEYMKKRGRNKEESYNFILSQVNNLFFNPLKLEEWDQLVAYHPEKKENISAEYSNIENETYVPYSTIANMEGYIEFEYVKDPTNLTTDCMKFNYAQLTRALSLGTLNEDTGYRGDNFSSLDKFPEKTSFKLKVQNTAFLYVFAVNSDNTCYNIYPYSQEWLDAFSMSRSLGIGTLPGKDDNNVTIIPGKNSNTGEDNYINISGDAEKECLCVLLSKSELDINDVYKKIDLAQGTLSERINSVFTDNIISSQEAQTAVNGCKITYNANASSKTVLPFIFYINRK